MAVTNIKTCANLRGIIAEPMWPFFVAGMSIFPKFQRNGPADGIVQNKKCDVDYWIGGLWNWLWDTRAGGVILYGVHGFANLVANSMFPFKRLSGLSLSLLCHIPRPIVITTTTWIGQVPLVLHFSLTHDVLPSWGIQKRSSQSKCEGQWARCALDLSGG